MIRNRIVKDYSKYVRSYGFHGTDHDTEITRLSIKEEMRTNAIHDNGISKTFCFSDECYDLTLDYIKIEDNDIELYPDMFEKQFKTKLIHPSQTVKDKDAPEYKDILESCIMYNKTGEIDDKLKHIFKEIEEECVKKYNAVYSTININYVNIYKTIDCDPIFIHYGYYHIKDDFIDKISSYDVIFGKAPLPYEEWFNSGSHSTDDSSRKVGIALTKDVELALNKGYIDCSVPDSSKINTYYSENALNEAKENSNMKIHLLIVPKGMSEEFVNNTKKNLQSDDNTTLYVSSNDIAFEPNDKYKTKYELFEYWVKSGEIHCVEFMIGYENDPDAKAFEAFIRGFIKGIRTSSASVDTVNLWYQKDTIERAVNNLRSDYNHSSIIRSNLNSITDTIMDKVKVFKEYGLEDNDLDVIRNADCDRKDAYNATVDKITEIAFASDKKGSKGNKK